MVNKPFGKLVHRSFYRCFPLAGLLLANLAWANCNDTGLQLQILGSGGPGASGGRASAAYVLWRDGKSRVLIDAGSGTKDNFFKASASLQDLQLIALSHLHPDHSAELPALLWPSTGNFRVAGPTAGNVIPDIQVFLDRLFGASGAFPVFANRVAFDTLVVDVQQTTPVEVWRENGLVLTALRVPHADVPTLGYRFDLDETSIAFTSDQNGSNPDFIEFIRGVDVLVIHLAVSEDVNETMGRLHARPSVWGQMAAAAGVGRVVASHISAAQAELAKQLAMVQSNYSGQVIVGEDLLCVALTD